MRHSEPEESWVVYHIPMRGNFAGANAVCSKNEWEVKAANPTNELTLIRSQILNEGEAERLARGDGPPVKAKVSKAKIRTRTAGLT